MPAELDYSLHGLTIRSELPLDGAPARRRARGDYTLTVGGPRAVERRPDGEVVAEVHLRESSFWCVAEAELAGEARWRFAYRFLGEIDVGLSSGLVGCYPAPDQDPRVLGVLFSSGVLSYLLAARGAVMLHASAVERDGRALALAAPRGVGKTTLAGLFCSDGARLVSDDALRIDLDGEVRCYPGTNTLRLRSSHFTGGLKWAERTRTPDGRLGVSPAAASDGVFPIDAIILPRPDPDRTSPSARRLRERDALVGLLACQRATGWVSTDISRASFHGFAALASAVPVVEVAVPWGPPFSRGLVASLLQAVAEVTSGG